MTTSKDDAMELANLLRDAEVAAPTPELTSLHESLWVNLQKYAGALGLTYDDLIEIGNVGMAQQRGGGTPKTPEPT